MSESMRKCTFAGGCDRRVYAKELCSTHYEQHRKGKPLAPIGSYSPQPATCAFMDGCDKKPYARGLCAGHYTQQKRGEALAPLGARRRGKPSSRDERLCVVEKCPGAREEEDLFCANHWVQLRPRIGDPRPGKCRVLGCETGLHSHGFCQAHWGRITRYGRVDRVYAVNVAEHCVAGDGDEKCPNPVHAKGYCRTHYRRLQRTGETGPAELISQAQRQPSKYAGVTCKAEADGKRCERPATSKGWCRMHYHRWRRSGDPVGKWGIEPRQSRGYLTSDGYRMSPERRNGRPILEHRLVMEQMIGRPLHRHEQPHHKNGIRTDNRPDNLELWVNQPSGQRLSDLLEFVGGYYADEMREKLGLGRWLEALLSRLAREHPAVLRSALGAVGWDGFVGFVATSAANDFQRQFESG